MTITLLTATWRQDISRFRLLRQSLRELGAADQFPHVAVVNTEDLSKFDEFRNDRSLELVPSSMLLPRRLERRRAVANFRRTAPRHWVRGGALPGWFAQQLVKIAAPTFIGSDVTVILDSDTVLIGPIESRDFLTDAGKTRFFVDNVIRNDGSRIWNASAARFVEASEELAVGRQYIHWPVVFDALVTRAMCEWIAQRYQTTWQDAMVSADVYEYPLYGAWVSSRRPESVTESPPLPGRHFQYFEELWDLREAMLDVIDRGDTKFVSVQSRLHIPPESYSEIVARAWRRSR